MSERFKDADFLLQHVAAARRWTEEGEGRAFEEAIDQYVFRQNAYTPRLESPLEAVFYTWWYACVGRQGGSWLQCHLELREQVETSAAGEWFRLDFEMALNAQTAERAAKHGLAWQRLAVEMDGHAFHEKTREQVTYRNRRDRLLQQSGWRVFHLSFDEVNTRGADACLEVIHVALEAASKMHSAIFMAEDCVHLNA